MSDGQREAGGLDRVERTFHSPRDYQEAALAATADPEVLESLASLPYPFVREAVATNPNTRASTLLGLVPDTLATWRAKRLITLVVQHPNSNSAVIRRSYEVVFTALSNGQRSYAAAIALAADLRVTPEQVITLGHLAGASARLRQGLRRSRATLDNRFR